MDSRPPHDDRGAALLALARGSLCRAFGMDAPPCPDAPWLREPGATFVTLTLRGELRGCIGSLAAHRPLFEDVAENARAAAFRDPRFPPLSSDEARDTRIEVSLLTAPEPLDAATEAEAARLLRPGVDGVILSLGGRRGTFLPQVWDDLPDPRGFLAQLKLKAGLPPHAWPAGLRVETYRVTKFSEHPEEQA